jgi:hypothetical protein
MLSYAFHLTQSCTHARILTCSIVYYCGLLWGLATAITENVVNNDTKESDEAQLE